MKIDDILKDVDPIFIDCDGCNRLQKGHVLPRVHSVHGPLVILGRVAGKDIFAIRDSLDELVPVEVLDPTDEFEALERVKLAYLNFLKGEPYLPRQYVVALLIFAKLYKENFWGGNAKGYLWSSDLPKGRGIPPELQGYVLAVANLLHLREWLISKKSCGKIKYALNPEKRPAIGEIIRDFKIIDSELRKILLRDSENVSKNCLNQLRSLCNVDFNC